MQRKGFSLGVVKKKNRLAEWVQFGVFRCSWTKWRVTPFDIPFIILGHKDTDR